MKKVTTILTILILLIIQSCDKNDNCYGKLCFTPPDPFEFELVDKTTGENLFTNGTYRSNDIEVINIANDSTFEYFFISENDLNTILIPSIGWQTEDIECSLRVNNSEILRLFVSARRVSEDCCTFTIYDEIRIENVEYELDNQTGFYRLLID